MGIQFNDYERRIMDPRNPLELAHRQDASFAAMSTRWKNRELLEQGLFNPSTLPQPTQQNTRTMQEMLPVEQWLRDYSKPTSSGIFPTANGSVYGQMLQSKPIKVDKSEMTITEEGRKIKDKIDKILHQPTEFSPEKLDLYRGYGPNPEMDNLNNWYRNMQQSDNVITNDKINYLTGKVDEFGNKIDDFGNRFNNIDDYLGRLDSKADYIYDNVDKLKRGVGEANGKIIGKIDGLTNKVDDITKNVTGLGSKVDDIAKNITGLGGKVDGLTTRVDGIYENVDILKRGLGEVSGKILGKVDANGKAIGELGSKVDDIAKQMSKQNGKLAILAGVAALAVGVAGYFIGKNANKSEKAEEIKNETETPVVPTEPTTPVVPPVKPEEPTEPTIPVVPPVKPEEPTEPTIPVVPPVKPTEPDENANLPLDKDGQYTTVKGDSFWKIAKRHLADKFKNQPEKFANLTESERNKMIDKEMVRIMKLNGYEFDENRWYSKPMLQPNTKIAIIAKLEIAA